MRNGCDKDLIDQTPVAGACMDEPLKKAIEIIKIVANPDKIILFGSRSIGGGDARSDYDLLVLKRGVTERRKLAQRIYLNFKNIGAPIDVIVEDPERFESLKENPYLVYHEIAHNGRIVYEQ